MTMIYFNVPLFDDAAARATWGLDSLIPTEGSESDK